MHYNWLATLVFIVLTIALLRLGKWLVFHNADLARMRDINREQDAQKMALAKYPPMVKSSQLAGAMTNLLFLVAIAPFIITFEPPALWQVLLQSLGTLMLYDFFYYLMHRFLLHGNSRFRRVHGVHHQARLPSQIDALYVHPLETAMGLGLFLVCLGLVSLLSGGIHVLLASIVYVLYAQQNVINHAFFRLPHFPFRSIDYLTTKHHIHHRNMNSGNYASITPLYDYLFGTLE